jgi:hypothetical protein
MIGVALFLRMRWRRAAFGAALMPNEANLPTQPFARLR